MINRNLFNHIVDGIESEEGVQWSDPVLKSDVNYRIANEAFAFNKYQGFKEDRKRRSYEMDKAEKRKSLEIKRPTHDFCSYCEK